jgi:hypothetical protein
MIIPAAGKEITESGFSILGSWSSNLINGITTWQWMTITINDFILKNTISQIIMDTIN